MKWIFWLALAALALVFVLALDGRLTTRRYRLTSSKITGTLRLALLTDLHNDLYGDGQSALLQAITRENPDFVLMGGDMANNALHSGHARRLMESLAEEYPCYFVTGNHEQWSGDCQAMLDTWRALGVTVLQGQTVELAAGTARVRLTGVSDPAIGRSAFLKQLEENAPREGDAYSVLLSHRPEYAEEYARFGYDLALSGHAHGGQWRLPGLINGLYAPSQGLFPPYAGGLYELGASRLIVSRGLCQSRITLPRIFNPPEVVIVEISGQEG